VTAFVDGGDGPLDIPRPNSGVWRFPELTITAPRRTACHFSPLPTRPVTVSLATKREMQGSLSSFPVVASGTRGSSPVSSIGHPLRCPSCSTTSRVRLRARYYSVRSPYGQSKKHRQHCSVFAVRATGAWPASGIPPTDASCPLRYRHEPPASSTPSAPPRLASVRGLRRAQEFAQRPRPPSLPRHHPCLQLILASRDNLELPPLLLDCHLGSCIAYRRTATSARRRAPTPSPAPTTPNDSGSPRSRLLAVA